MAKQFFGAIFQKSLKIFGARVKKKLFIKKKGVIESIQSFKEL